MMRRCGGNAIRPPNDAQRNERAAAPRRLFASWCISLLCAFGALTAAAETPIALNQSFVGNYNYVATGGSLRAAPNTTNACSLNATSTNTVSGVPAGATISAVYLYWTGSGTTTDTTVTLNGASITADRTDTIDFPFNGTNYRFFNGFADITSRNIVSGNGSFTFGNLSVNNGAPYCGVQTVVAGWALVVVYEQAGEPLRAVNLFDGFQQFRASAVTLTSTNFRVPQSGIEGRFSVITWEGDPQNSGAVNGFAESLTFNGTVVDDGIVPPASNPTVQQYDGTVNTAGQSNTHGVDVDSYDVTPFLSPGDESASTILSSGADLVMVSAQVVAVTTDPLVDLTITKTHPGDFVVGQNGTFTIGVGNNGPEPDANAITVMDTLPAGLTYVAGTGTGWSCGASGQDVTCVHPGPAPVGTNLPDLQIDVAVGPAAAPGVTNTARVSSASRDTDDTNNSADDVVTVLASDLSGSTKSVVDLNGGDADPGDTLRYTITLNESGGIAAGGVRVTDDVPVNTGALTIVSIPAGANDASTTAGGANGNGLVDIGNVSVPAGGSAAIVFDVVIAAAAAPGDRISNTATITNPNGTGAAPAAPEVIVSASQVSVSGTKTLYLYGLSTADPNGFDNGPPPYLSRTPPPGVPADVQVDKDDPPVTWRLTPALQAPLTIAAGTVPVTLYVSKGGGSGSAVARELRVELLADGVPVTALTQTFSAPSRNAPIPVLFDLPLAADAGFPASTTLQLRLTNVTAGGGSRRIRVFPTFTGQPSRIDMTALTVIDVASVDFADAAFPAGNAVTSVAPGDTVYVRARITDPFGSFDIASADISVVNPLGTEVLTQATMTRVEDGGLDNALFEYGYTLPAAGPAGQWSFRVRGVEGVEAIVTDTRTANLTVATNEPTLTVTKTVVPVSDPVNGSTNPLNIPGAIVEYAITVVNTGPGSPDPGTLTISDMLPGDAALLVDGSAGPVVEFRDGAVPSGLIFTYANDARFSTQPGGGPPYDYFPPSAGPDGTDRAVTGLRVVPQGTMNGDAGAGSPAFTILFRVLID